MDLWPIYEEFAGELIQLFRHDRFWFLETYKVQITLAFILMIEMVSCKRTAIYVNYFIRKWQIDEICSLYIFSDKYSNAGVCTSSMHKKCNLLLVGHLFKKNIFISLRYAELRKGQIVATPFCFGLIRNQFRQNDMWNADTSANSINMTPARYIARVSNSNEQSKNVKNQRTKLKLLLWKSYTVVRAHKYWEIVFYYIVIAREWQLWTRISTRHRGIW